LWQRKSRALVAVLALTLAATLTAALLNLYVDAQRKIRSEFRRYGANLMVTPRVTAGENSAAELLHGALARQLKRDFFPDRLTAVVPYLYAVVELKGESVVLAGTWLDQFSGLGGFRLTAGDAPGSGAGSDKCWVGAAVAARFELSPGETIVLRYREAAYTCQVAGVVETGQAEDNQVLADLAAVQALAGAPGRLNVILARAGGDATAIEQTVQEFAALFPQASVNPLRQVTESEFRVVQQIRGAVLGTTGVVLLITALCVLATMTALAFERRRTIGTLKALGATNARISWLFLSEAAVLALVATAAGFPAGVGLARWLGETLFAATVAVRWTTLPVVAAVAVAIALVGTLLPLRLVRQTQPAVILRGE
jgi:putative ABC transport system permease protein